MKKVLSLLVVVCMLCVCLGALAQAEDVTGVWHLTSFEADGMELAASILGMEMTMTLNTDGTALLESNMAETEIGTWTLQGEQVEVTDAVGDVQTFTMEEERLTGEEDGIKLIFTRENGGEAADAESPVRTDATREEFNGVWNSSYVMMSGIQMPMSLLNMNITLEITSDKVVMTTAEGEETESLEVDAAFAEGVLSLADGAMNLHLHEDGQMSFTDEDAGMAMYFEKTAE